MLLQGSRDRESQIPLMPALPQKMLGHWVASLYRVLYSNVGRENPTVKPISYGIGTTRSPASDAGDRRPPQKARKTGVCDTARDGLRYMKKAPKGGRGSPVKRRSPSRLRPECSLRCPFRPLISRRSLAVARRPLICSNSATMSAAVGSRTGNEHIEE
jgi:hypothetical protein